MGYLFSVMWMCLAVAFVLGILLSHLWRRARFQRMTADSEKSWLSRLRQTEQDRDTRIAQLTTELEGHRQQVPTMERSLAERSDIINALENTLESSKITITSLEAQLAEAQRGAAAGSDGMAAEEAASHYSQRIAEIEREIEKHSDEASAREQEFKQLQAEHSNALSRAEEAEQKLENLGNNQHEQQTLIDGHADAASEAQNKLAVSEQRVADLKQELSAINGRHSRLQSEHGGCASQLDAVARKLTDMKEDLVQQATRAEDIHTRLDDRTSELESARSKIEELTTALDGQRNAGQRVVELERKIQAMHDEAARHAQSLAQAELRKTDLEQTLRSRTDKLESAEQQCAQLRDRLAEIETQNSQSSEQRIALTSELAGAQSRAEDARSDLAEWRKQAEQLKGQLQAREQAAAELREQAERWQNERDKLKAQLANQSSLVDEARQEARQLRHELTQTQNAEDAARARNAEWQQRLDSAEHVAAAQVRELKNRISELEQRAELTGRQIEEAEMLRRTLQERDVEYAREHQQCNEQRGLARDWRARYEALQAEHDRLAAAQSAARNARTGSKAPVAMIDKPDWLLSEAPAETDDLKKIWGVGPVMEKTMNDLGIYLYRQVAALRKSDIEWIASHINAFAGRITRDDWIGQAAELRKEKYGR